MVKIVQDSLALIEEFSPKPDTNIENISTFCENGMGSYIDRIEKLDDRTRYQLLQNPWILPSAYSFPYPVYKKQDKDEKRFFTRTPLEEIHWLVLSNMMRLLSCKYCVLFNLCGVGGSNQLQKLVKKPLSLVTYAKLTGKDGDLVIHENNQYPHDSADTGKHFLLKYDNA